MFELAIFTMKIIIGFLVIILIVPVIIGRRKGSKNSTALMIFLNFLFVGLNILLGMNGNPVAWLFVAMWTVAFVYGLVSLTRDNMYTGLSFSVCIRDIVDGFIPFDQVDKIIAATAASTPEDWDKEIEHCKKVYWYRKPVECECLARLFIRAGKIEQPRLRGKKAHNIDNGHWLLNGKLVRLSR
jgi:hypothetical protein